MNVEIGWLIVGLMIGVLIMLIIYKIIDKSSGHGILEVNQTDPNKDTLFFRLENVNDVFEKKRLVLHIVNTDSAQK